MSERLMWREKKCGEDFKHPRIHPASDVLTSAPDGQPNTSSVSILFIGVAEQRDCKAAMVLSLLFTSNSNACTPPHLCGSLASSNCLSIQLSLKCLTPAAPRTKHPVLSSAGCAAPAAATYISQTLAPPTSHCTSQSAQSTLMAGPTGFMSRLGPSTCPALNLKSTVVDSLLD
ncbi:hypothetical protein MHYP_G00304610 [Metynnis hypsauchen]